WNTALSSEKMEDTLRQQLATAGHYLEVGRPERALELLVRMGDGALEEPAFWELRASAAFELWEWAEAAAVARRGLAVDRENVILLDIVALSELELDQHRSALAAIDFALDALPEHPLLLAHRSLILAHLERFDEARDAIDGAMRMAPESPEVLRVRMKVAILSGDDAAAERFGDDLLA